MAKVLYAIPSRGRWNRMLVMSYLPKWVREQLHIFVIPEEKEKYKENWPETTVVAVPSWVDHIERKRLFMFKYAKKHGYDAIFMFDDDLSLAAWNPEIKKFRSVRENPEILTVFFRKTIPELFDRAPGVGLGCKFMADGKVLKNGLEEVNGKMCCAFGYRVDEALEFINWERTYHLWNLDTTMNLYFLANGLPLLVHYGVTWSTDFDVTAQDPSKGGCAIYRKQSVINEAFLRMVWSFPGLVTRKKKMSTHPTSFLQISWKNAYGHFLKMGIPVTNEAIKWAKKMKLSLPSYDEGYAEKMKEARAYSLRLELFIQGKTRDHLKLDNKSAIAIVTDESRPEHEAYARRVENLDDFLAKYPTAVHMKREASDNAVLAKRKKLF